MRFSFAPWGREAPEGAVACDGLVPGARLDLSHWSNNKTPAHLKRDTSVEIALAFLEERGSHDVEVVTNNHFDSDGVLAVWALLRPELAIEHARVIVSAAECGDFEEWPEDERGIWLDAAITASASSTDLASYARVLPLLDDLVPTISGREDLWGDAHRALLLAGERLRSGAITVETQGRLAIVAHERGMSELPGPWIARSIPGTVDRVLLAFAEDEGWRYRYELRRWSWADTVDRPRLPMPKRGPIKRALGPEWIIKGRRGMSGLAYTAVPIAMPPRIAAERLRALS